MTVGDVTAGRRLPDGSDVEALELPGDYYLGGYTDGHGARHRAVWFLLPIHEGDVFDHTARGSGLHTVEEPPWVFRECPDGSLEIRESIACGRGSPDGEYWHGYLDEGHRWREV